MSHPLRVYLIGSLRQERVPQLGIELRARGFDVFDDWHSNGREADDRWQEYEQRRGRSFADAVKAPVAQNTFALDKRFLDWCDVAVLVLPAGKSGHLELGYAIGKGKRGIILLDEEPERFDVMYAFAEAVVTTTEQLVEQLSVNTVRELQSQPPQGFHTALKELREVRAWGQRPRAPETKTITVSEIWMQRLMLAIDQVLD